MRRFEFVAGSTSKFWEIALDGPSYTVRSGRVGTKGRASTKSFADKRAAKAAHDAIIREKVAEGYVETSAGGAVSKASAPAAAKEEIRRFEEGSSADRSVVVFTRVGARVSILWTSKGNELRRDSSTFDSEANALRFIEKEIAAYARHGHKEVSNDPAVRAAIDARADADAARKAAAVKAAAEKAAAAAPREHEIRRVAKPTDASIPALFASDLTGIRMLDLKGGALGDKGAFELLLALRSRPQITRVDVSKNRIGVPGLRALGLLGERVIPGVQYERPSYLGGFASPENFEGMDGDTMEQLAESWRATVDELMVQLETAIGRALPEPDDTGERRSGRPLAPSNFAELITFHAACEQELDSAMAGDFGSDWGLGFIALGESMAWLHGTLQSAHDRGDIAVWRDESLAQALYEEAEAARKEGTVGSREIEVPVPLPRPASLDDDALKAAWLASPSQDDRALARKLARK